MIEAESGRLPVPGNDSRDGRAAGDRLEDLLERLDSGKDSDVMVDGQPVGLVSQLSLALEELRVEHEELTRSVEELHHQQRLLLSGLSGGSAATRVWLDGQGMILAADTAARRLLGSWSRGAVGRPVANCVAAVDRRQVRTAVSACAAGVRSAVLVHLELGGGRTSSWVMAFSPHPGPSADMTDGAPGVMCLILPVDSMEGLVDDADGIAAVLTQLCGIHLGDGLDSALQQVAALVVQGVAGVDGAKIEWREGGAELEVGNNAEARSRSWPDLAEQARVCGLPARSEPPVRGVAPAVVCLPVEAGPAMDSAVLTCWGRDSALLATVDRLAPYVSATAALLNDAAQLRLSRRTEEQLREAIASRGVIEQAKGMIMAATGVDSEIAFTHLKRLSSYRNVKLRAIAIEIVEDTLRRARQGGRS